MHDIAILNEVFLAFDAKSAIVAASGFGAVLSEILVGDHFCLNESSFKISVNHTCSLRCLPAMLDSPGSNFLHARCEIGGEVE